MLYYASLEGTALAWGARAALASVGRRRRLTSTVTVQGEQLLRVDLDLLLLAGLALHVFHDLAPIWIEKEGH